MPKKARELNALAVKRLTQPGLWAVGGVDGLQLRVKPSGARSWIYRTKVGKRRPDIGLGGYPDVTLEMARTKARGMREQIRQGIDPIAARNNAAAVLLLAQAKDVTFDQAAKRCHAAKLAGWKNAKHRDQWLSSLEEHASPKIGSIPIGLIGRPQVLEVLEPIWLTKTETATRIRQRIEAVIDWAMVSGLRDDGPNPAAWNGNLKHVLPKAEKVKRVRHFPALPWERVGEFMHKLRAESTASASALELLILTAARPHMVREATWDEFDFKDRIWSLTAQRMKSEKSLRIPLSPAALELLRKIPRHEGTKYVFPGRSGKKPISDVTMTKLLRDMHAEEIAAGRPGFLDTKQNRIAVPHGFRSSFKDWARSSTKYADEVTELSLAHINSDATRAAYARDELLPLRTRLMSEWTRYCAAPARKGNVVSIRGRSHG